MSWLLHFECGANERDIVSSRLWDLGTTGIAELSEGKLVAGFETESEAFVASNDLGRGTVSAYDPAVVSTPAPAAVPFRDSTIMLDDTSVFGHGSHVTTRLALAAIEPMTMVGLRILDLGCGTGVLSIAAALSGGTVTAVDNDPNAVCATSTNAKANGCNIEILAEVPTLQFDAVIANLLLADLRTVAKTIADSLAPSGRLITTGFLRGQVADVRALFPNLLESRRSEDGEWTLLELSA